GLGNSNRIRRHSPACSWNGSLQAPWRPPSFSDGAIRSTERFATSTYLYRSLAWLPRAPSSTVGTQSARSVALWLQAWPCGGFDPLPGVVIPELRRAQGAERGGEPACVVALVNEVEKIRGDWSWLRMRRRTFLELITSPRWRSSAPIRR